MKKMLLFGLLIFLGCKSHAQYQSVFGKDSTQWNIYWVNLDLEAYSVFYTRADTTINNIVYHKITLDDETYAFLREDTVSGKVWRDYIDFCGNYIDTTPRLVMDMSLQLGDTFNISHTQFNFGNGDTIRTVDSVYYQNGARIIRFGLNNAAYPTEPIKFIEGVGPNYSPLWNERCTVMQDKYLLCSYKDGIQSNYINLGTNGDCNPVFTAVNDLYASRIRISPNPASDKIIISGVGDVVEYLVSDITGRLYPLPGSKGEIDISSLSPGLYVLRIYDHAIPATYRFIKK